MSAPETPYKQPSAVPPRSRGTERSPAATGPVVPLWVGRTLAWLVFAFSIAAAVLLLIAFFLQLTGANPTAPFAALVYRSTDVLLQPFRSLYPTVKGHSGRSELNLSLVFAILMYGLFALVFNGLVAWFDRWIRRMR